MSKYLSLFFLLLFATAGYSQSGLEVVSTDIPPAPPTAIAVGAAGLVDILVTIDAEGNVTSADVFNGHPLLRQVSQRAALKWKFNKSEIRGELRTANITFDFLRGENVRVIERSEKKVETVSSAKFLTSFWAEVTTTNIVPALLLLPREKGKVASQICPLHQEEMLIDIVYTSIDSDPGDAFEAYEKATEDKFPNANIWFRDGAAPETKEAEIPYCKTCRAKREEWLKQQEIEQQLDSKGL